MIIAWSNADSCGLDTRKIYKPTVLEYKPPRGRPPKLPAEVLKCERRPDWYWSDFVSSDECQAGDKFHEDWRRSGLKPVQTQQFRQADCCFQAASGTPDWVEEDQECWSAPGTARRSKNFDIIADESVTRTYANGTLHITFKNQVERDPDEETPDVVSRIERSLTPAGDGAADEPSPTRRHPKPVARRTGLSETEVTRMIEQFFGGGGVVRVFDERGKLLEHRDWHGNVLEVFAKLVAPKWKRNSRKLEMESAKKRGMRPLVDPADCTQWPIDDAAGRHRLEHRWAREMLDRVERELVENVICRDREWQATDVAALRTALSKLSVHYRRHDYEHYVEERLALERRKADEWLTLRGLCL